MAQKQVSAKSILQRVALKYSSLTSYEDDGIVVTTYEEQTSGRIEKLPFKLLFKRPGRFYFEWIDYYVWQIGRKSVVWSNGKDTFFYQHPDTHEKNESLESGIAAAAGISFGAVYNIPRMLLPKVGGWSLTDLRNPMLVGEEMFEAEPCYRISGIDHDGDMTEIWISKKGYLVRNL